MKCFCTGCLASFTRGEERPATTWRCGWSFSLHRCVVSLLWRKHRRWKCHRLRKLCGCSPSLTPRHSPWHPQTLCGRHIDWSYVYITRHFNACTGKCMLVSWAQESHNAIHNSVTLIVYSVYTTHCIHYTLFTLATYLLNMLWSIPNCFSFKIMEKITADWEIVCQVLRVKSVVYQWQQWLYSLRDWFLWVRIINWEDNLPWVFHAKVVHQLGSYRLRIHQEEET